MAPRRGYDFKSKSVVDPVRLQGELDRIYAAFSSIRDFVGVSFDGDGSLRGSSVLRRHLVDGAFSAELAEIERISARYLDDVVQVEKSIQNFLLRAVEAAKLAREAGSDAGAVLGRVLDAVEAVDGAAVDILASRSRAERAYQLSVLSQADAETASASARISEDMAYRWAEKLDGPVFVPSGGDAVDDGFYSSKFWAQQAGIIVKNGSYFYLGPHAVPPIEGNQGQPLEQGMWYYDTTDQTSYYWNGTGWVAIQDADAVVSVFGRQGAVIAQQADYAAFYALLGHTHTLDEITDFEAGDWVSRVETADQSMSGSLHVRGRISASTVGGSGDVGTGIRISADASNAYIDYDVSGSLMTRQDGVIRSRMYGSGIFELYEELRLNSSDTGAAVFDMRAMSGTDALVRFRQDGVQTAEFRYDVSASHMRLQVEDGVGSNARDYYFRNSSQPLSDETVLRKLDADPLYAAAVHEHTEDQITDLDRMRWLNTWVDGTGYEASDTVRDGDWLMVANKATSDRPAPQTSQGPLFIYGGGSPDSTSTAKQLIMGQRYTNGTVDEIFNVTGFRVNTVAGNTYRVFSVAYPGEDRERVTELIQFTASLDGWQEFGVSEVFFAPGDVFDVVAIVQEPDPVPTTLTLSYSYQKPNNASVPTAGQISHSSKVASSLRVHKTDQSGDQSGPLSGITIGDVINGPNVSWAVQAVTDNGTWIDFSVAPAQQDSASGVNDFVFETVTATPITYVQDLAYWTTNPDVQGLYGADIDYPAIVPDQNQYSVDVKFGRLEFSPDWDIAAVNGKGASAGGDSGGGGATNFLALADTPTTYAGQAGRLAVVNSSESGLEFVDGSGAGDGYLPLTGGTLTGDFVVDVDDGTRENFRVRQSDGLVFADQLLLKSELQPRIIMDAQNALTDADITFYSPNGGSSKWVNIVPIGFNTDTESLRFRVGPTSEPTSAELHKAGTFVPTAETIITAEKGDARYITAVEPVLEQSLTVRQTSGTEWPEITIDKINDGDSARFYGQHNGLNRWSLDLGAAGLEAGGNLGSDFSMNRYADDGSLIDTPFIIRRDTGVAEFPNGILGGSGPYFEEFHDPAGVASWKITGTTLEMWGWFNTISLTVGQVVTMPKSFANMNWVLSMMPADEGSLIRYFARPIPWSDATVNSFNARVQDTAGNQIPGLDVMWEAKGEWDGAS